MDTENGRQGFACCLYYSHKAQEICIHIGSFQESTAPLVGEAEFDGQESHDQNLGVDSGEISEHHLQAALSSTQLASDNADSASREKSSYHIPTPNAKGVLSPKEFAALYPSGVYQDPITYVRFSDTVEDCIRGPSYNLDEDDAEWLEDRNAKAREDLVEAVRNYKPAANTIKGKNKEKYKEDPAVVLARTNPSLRIISEDEFEMVMTVFEQVSSDQVPFAHLDPSNLPTLEQLLPSFDADSPLSIHALPSLPDLAPEQQASTSASAVQTAEAANTWERSNPYRNLHLLKPLAAGIYPWWKQRREEREGNLITPFLNFDEANDNDPYVCFRRREVKSMRKTRKTDALHIEKLVRLRSELDSANTVVSAVAQRERIQRASIQRKKARWESVRDVSDCKRLWELVAAVKAPEEEEEKQQRDEESKARKKRKTEEAGAAKASRKSRTSVEPGSVATSSTAPGSSAGLGSAILERVQAVQLYVERECASKSLNDVGWEEGSDAVLQPVPAPAALRAFRPISSETPDAQLSSSTSTRAGRPPSFRRRVGRGGRVFLDRRLPAPSPVPASLSDWPRLAPTTEGAEADKPSPSTAPGAPQQHPQAYSSVTQAARPREEQSRLTGPFAFLSTIRPSLLTAPRHNLASATSTTGPFAEAPSQSQVSEDASSTSSESSDRYRSNASATSAAGSVSTQPTEADLDETFDKLGTDFGMDLDEEEDVFDSDSWEKMQERWRYDDESGRWAGLGLCGLGGMEDDEEAVLDDFDQRFLRYRCTLLEEADLLKLSTDPTHLAQAKAAAEQPVPQPSNVIAVGGLPQIPAGSPQRAAQQAHAQAQAQAQAAAAAAAAMAQSRQANGGPAPNLAALQQQQQLHYQQILAMQQRAAAQHSQGRASPGGPRRPGSSAGQSQPHPLSQSLSFAGGMGLPNMNGNGSSPQLPNGQSNLNLNLAGQRPANVQQLPGQSFPNGFHGLNVGAGSPPIPAHLAGQQRPSASPSPNPSDQTQKGQVRPSPQQQTQRINGHPAAGQINLAGLSAADLQAAFAQINGGQPLANAQVLAMKAAMANPNMQLKMPANRAMQLQAQAMNGSPVAQNGQPMQFPPGGMNHAVMQALAAQVQQANSAAQMQNGGQMLGPNTMGSPLSSSPAMGHAQTHPRGAASPAHQNAAAAPQAQGHHTFGYAT